MSTKFDYTHWHEKVLEVFKTVFQRVLKKDSNFKELEEITKAEGRMYDEDGAKTMQYEKALEAFDSSLEKNPQGPSSILSEDSPALQESIAAAHAMIEERQRLMRDYENDQRNQDPDTPFDAMEWMGKKIPEDALDAAKQRVRTELETDVNSTIEDYGTDNQ